MWCSHNNVDLRIGLSRRNNDDYVVIRCKVCRQYIGGARPLDGLIKMAVKRANAERALIDKRLEKEGEKE